jgi:Flp pilus assembly protein TadG
MCVRGSAAARSRRSRCGQVLPADAGSVTIEAALGLAALALVLAACLAGIACLLAQLRCADAAREAARLAARGDDAGAAQAVSALAPAGASLALSGDDLVTATVTAAPVAGLLPGVVISASASASRESATAGP